MLVIDSQIHFFGPRGSEVPGLAAHRKLSVPGILAEMDAAGVSAAVLVPARPDPSATNELALDAVAAAPTRLGVMGRMSLDEAAERDGIRRWLDSSLLGYRVSFPPGQSRLGNAAHEWLWRSAAEVGAPLMLWAPGQLQDVGQVARRYPELKLVVDHLGLAVADMDDTVAVVVRDLIELAVHPNVAVKASGIPGHTSEVFPFTNMHAPVHDAIGAFGADRVFWGTDLTTLPCNYRDAVRMFESELGLHPEEREQVLGVALARWLGWTAVLDSQADLRLPTNKR